MQIETECNNLQSTELNIWYKNRTSQMFKLYFDVSNSLKKNTGDVVTFLMKTPGGTFHN